MRTGDTSDHGNAGPGPAHNHPAGHGGGGYGYGYGDEVGSADSAPHRNFRDYLLILRERMWYVIVVFLVIFSASLVYTFSRTKQYTAGATIEIMRRDAVVMKVEEVRDTELRGPEDLNTQVKLLESFAIIQKVSERLVGPEAKAFMAAYEKGGSGDPIMPREILGLNRKVIPVRQTRLIMVTYTHPNPEVAAKVANLFVDEFVTYNSRQRMSESMKAVEDLKNRAESQSQKVQELAINLQSYRERNNMVSLDQRKDIVTEKLKALNILVTQASSRMKESEVRWAQVQEFRQSTASLADLTFIATVPLIQNLSQQVAAQKIGVAQLQQRYRAKHPKMHEALQSLSQTEAELTRALDTVANNISSEYQTNRRTFEEARADLAAQELEALKLDRLMVEYQSQKNTMEVNEQLLANIVGRMRETAMSANIETQNARRLDAAVAPRPENHSSPNRLLHTALGFFGGLGLGLAFAFFVAFIDDRVKSAFDIEAVVGLPLIAIVPQIRRMEPMEKSQVAISNADPQAAEAFLSLHSNLRLKDESKNAKVIIITSTTPSEGKSFVSSNLALTFAAHGERTIIVDCDLRKPNVHRSFGVENLKGVIDYCVSGAPLDSLIIKDHLANFDILPAGGRAKNPTQILNGKNFELLIAELRTRYDRVFIDTPPLAAVSDAMLVLPLADGSIFTIMFNHVRRKAAQFCARRLMDANVPCFGAVLNALNLSVSGYYYAQYYDKSYKDYFVVADDGSESEKQ
ncbi:MAG: polysaccharide biosynthesis tyrosine autokinase [Opitutaceae bacterium]|nr:polysaccharide biosynthesis tyrosine autokinase [Opitutaceae bacterium]